MDEEVPGDAEQQRFRVKLKRLSIKERCEVKDSRRVLCLFEKCSGSQPFVKSQ